MKKMFYAIIFLSASVFIFFLTVTGSVAEPLKTLGVGSAFGRLDFVNIGTPADENAHEGAGWGPIEPTTHGGNWGGLQRNQVAIFPTLRIATD